jgi:hypothetical protein
LALSTKMTKGNGNIYADFGFKNAEEDALKAELERFRPNMGQAS